MHHPLDTFILNRSNLLLDLYLVAVFTISLLGALSVKGIANTTLFLMAIPALFLVFNNVNGLKSSNQMKQCVPFIVMFCLPVFAVFISQFARQDWSAREFDGPSRMLLSSLVLLLLTHKKVDFALLIRLATPLVVIITLLAILLIPETSAKWANRYATFIDPNTLGLLMSVMAGFCLYRLTAKKLTSHYELIYNLVGLLIGLFIVLKTGTRAAWLYIGFALLVWACFRIKQRDYSTLLVLSSISLALLLFFPSLTGYLLERALLAVNSIQNWLDGVEYNSSTGYRLSIWHMTLDLIAQQPLWGYGDKGFIPYLSQPWFAVSATDEAKQLLANTGPHSQLLGSILKYGVLGGIATLTLFLLPLKLFLRHINDDKEQVGEAAKLGTILISAFLTIGMTVEVFHLKYVVSFYSLMLCGFVAQVISQHSLKK